MKKLLKINLMAFMSLMVVSACEPFGAEEIIPKEELTVESAKKTTEPKDNNDGNGGNLSCSDLGIAYENTSGRINYDENTGTFYTEDESGERIDYSWPAGFSITVAENKYVSWSYDNPGSCLDSISFIVKGGPGANVYSYGSGISEAEGLVSPLNNGGQIPNLSNLTVCYNIVPCVETCYAEDTAWGAGTRYVSKGNWATYSAASAGSVTLFAGQTKNAGSVTFNTNSDGTVTISIALNAGWSLQDVSEGVKIQGYDVAPTSNPSPGLFTTFKGNDLVVTVPAYKYYGVHVDARQIVDCQ